MNRRLFYPVRLAVSLIMACCIYMPAWPAFEMERPGARPSGLGGAFCALADDADALNYNPAGLARIFSTTFSFNYVKLLSGLDDGALADSRIACLQPLGRTGTMGISWYQRGLADLYQENLVTLAYGFPLDGKGGFLFGGALKIMHQAYLDAEATGQNPYFNYDTSVMGYGFDLGGIIRITDHLSAGLSLLNLNQPDLALFASADSKVPLQVRMGGAFQQDKYAGVLEYLWRGEDFRFSAGGEVWWFERLLGTRLGISLGDRSMSELTAGLSFRRQAGAWGWQIDYAFINPVGDFAGLGLTHQINCSVFFGAAGAQDKNVRRAKKLVKAGELSRKQGELKKALEIWEQAAEILPGDRRLAFRIKDLKKEILVASKVKRYLRKGRNFEKKRKYLNAAKEYRKILALVPKQVEAARRLTKIEDKIRKKSRSRKRLQKQKEKKVVSRVREKTAKPISRTGRKVKKTKYKVKKKTAAKKPKVKVSAVKIAGKESVVPPGKKTTDNKRLRKRARGAYGRAVKLMLDIDKLNGKKYFPAKHLLLKREMGRIKALLKNKDYSAAISKSRKMHEKLKKFRKKCAAKDKVRKAMPTNW